MPDTAIDLKFAGGDYRFWLSMREIVQLEKECDKSVLEMHDDMIQSIGMDEGGAVVFYGGGGKARFADIRATIRLGLIGGNSGKHADGTEGPVGPNTARDLVERFVDIRPIAETLPVAWAVLNAAIMGVDLKKKAQPESEAEAVTGASEKG